MAKIKPISFTVQLAPITKKNSQRIMINRTTGKPFIAPSKQYKQYEAAALWFIPKPYIPVKTPVNVKCLFYMPTHRATDLTNLLEAIDDAMVKAGLLADDNYNVIASHDGSRVLYDKENPRTEVYITEAVAESGSDIQKHVAQFKDKLLQAFGCDDEYIREIITTYLNEKGDNE